MKEYKGKIVLRIENIGAKSEGRYAYLESTDDRSIQLCREGAYPVNDSYFEPFEDKEVMISGEESHGWLIVKTIVESHESIGDDANDSSPKSGSELIESPSETITPIEENPSNN